MIRSMSQGRHRELEKFHPLADQRVVVVQVPVMLPPGLAMLWATPNTTGSSGTGRSPGFAPLRPADVVFERPATGKSHADVVACDQRCIPIDRGNAREVSHPSARRSCLGWEDSETIGPRTMPTRTTPKIPWSDRGHCAQAHQGDAGKSRWPWNSRVKVLPRIGFLASDFTRWSSVSASSFPFPSTHGRVGHLPLDRAPP